MPAYQIRGGTRDFVLASVAIEACNVHEAEGLAKELFWPGGALWVGDDIENDTLDVVVTHA